MFLRRNQQKRMFKDTRRGGITAGMCSLKRQPGAVVPDGRSLPMARRRHTFHTTTGREKKVWIWTQVSLQVCVRTLRKYLFGGFYFICEAEGKIYLDSGRGNMTKYKEGRKKFNWALWRVGERANHEGNHEGKLPGSVGLE